MSQAHRILKSGQPSAISRQQSAKEFQRNAFYRGLLGWVYRKRFYKVFFSPKADG